MQKPNGITITSLLMGLAILIGLVPAFTTHLPTMSGLPVSAAAIGGIARSLGVFFALLSAVFVFFYWQGHNWARWLVMIDSVFCLLSLIHISRVWNLSHLGGSLTIGKAVLAIFLLWYLNTSEVRAWFEKPTAVPA